MADGNGPPPTTFGTVSASGSDAEDGQNFVHDSQPEQDPSFQQLLRNMRALVDELDPQSKGTDDATLRRFLLARSRNVGKAAKMFVDHQKWRRSFVPHGCILEEEVMEELGRDLMFVQGRDKNGRPIGFVKAVKHIPSSDFEAFKRYVVFILDRLIASLPPGVERFCVIINLKGLGLKNIDIRGWILSFEFLQAYYPERLGRLFIIHAPYIFWGAWKVVARFLDKATAEKIVFVDNKEIPQGLLRDIDEGQLPEVLGGKLDLVPIQNAPTPNWRPRDLGSQSQ